MGNSLIVYRRHSQNVDGASACVKGYEQEDRVFGATKYADGLRAHEPHKSKEKNQDCECPIVADGALQNEAGRIRYRSLKTTHWPEAIERAKQWLAWGGTKAPEIEEEVLSPEGITIERAIEKFLSCMDEWGWGDGYQRHFRILLEQRLKPWANRHGLLQMESLSDLETATAFVYSWRNLNPTRNRTPRVPAPGDKKLGTKTRANELTRFREFMHHAFEQRWILANPAPHIKIGKRKKRKADEDGHDLPEHEERYGLSEEEYGWVLEEACRWGNPRRAQALRAMLLLLRHSGLRISDGATLDLGEIVLRESGKGHAIYLRMMKTQTWVYVPIPAEVHQCLMDLDVKGEKKGKRYVFWTGRGKMQTCIKNFANDIAELMHRAQRPKDKTIKGLENNYALQNYARPFQHRASVHSLRHTFATLALACGVPIQTVSRWLGHKNIRTTERFYIHACPELKVQSDRSYEEMMEKNQSGRLAHTGQTSVMPLLPLQ